MCPSSVLAGRQHSLYNSHMNNTSYIGEKFGMLTVLSVCEDKRYRLVQCDCGNQKFIMLMNMKRGMSKSCGCAAKNRVSPSLKDLSGKNFGSLTVTGRATAVGVKPVRWNCICSCGQSAVVDGSHLRNGHTKSCGCRASETAKKMFTTHGHASSKKRPTKTYGIWSAIKRRCYNKNCIAYKWYGGRGITMCDEWKNDFSAFLRDMGEQPPGLEIDRIDNNKGYMPGNCRWVTHQENCNNRSKRASNDLIHQR